MQLMDEKDIAQMEPNVAKNRDQPIKALGTEADYCAVDFGNLARSFIDNASTAKKRFDVLLNHRVIETKRLKNINNKEGYQLSVKTPLGIQNFTADFVVFSTGAYSLTYAQSLGYGHNYGNTIVDAWVATTQPEDWTSDDSTRLQSHINGYINE